MKDLKSSYNLKHLFLVPILSILFYSPLIGQNELLEEASGEISFLSSQNVYVKFQSTEGLNVGDTLLILNESQWLPALIISHKSSISCVCRSITDINLAKGVKVKMEKNKISDIIDSGETSPTAIEEEGEVMPPIDVIKDAIKEDKEKDDLANVYKEEIKGKISLSSYSNLYEEEGRESKHRMRYAFSFDGYNVNNSRFSFDAYINFRHTINEWYRVQENLGDALKVYNLALKYDFSPTANLWFGRRVNPNVSGIGAIDGLQFEMNSGQWTYGGLLGSRPDHDNYGYNFDLLEGGAFLSRNWKSKNISGFTTFAFLEMRNNSNVDRRYLYLQHRTQFYKKLSLFSFIEIDLFEKINEQAANTFQLTNFYLSLRYRANSKLSLSASYDARNNVIYYETYKNFIDRLIEEETRQGLRFSIHYKPIKKIRLGLSSSLRFQKDQENKSRNINGYITFSQIPLLKLSATVRANALRTNYIESNIYGFRISKDIIKRKLSGDFYFRLVKYNYANSALTVNQKLVGSSFNWRLANKFSLHFYLEGTFEESKNYYRVNTKIIKRI